MDDKLKQAIAAYEEENSRLLKLVNECCLESDFMLAHYHSIAVMQNREKLRILKKINDKFYDQKEYLKSRIEGLEKIQASAEFDVLRDLYKKQSEELKLKLNTLEALSMIAVPQISSGLIDGLLDQLISKKIQSFKLILSEKSRVRLDFSSGRKHIKITFPKVHFLCRQEIINPYIINAFKKPGFELSESGRQLVLVLPTQNENTLHDLKMIIAVIVFEILPDEYFETYIEVY